VPSRINRGILVLLVVAVLFGGALVYVAVETSVPGWLVTVFGVLVSGLGGYSYWTYPRQRAQYDLEEREQRVTRLEEEFAAEKEHLSRTYSDREAVEGMFDALNSKIERTANLTGTQLRDVRELIGRSQTAFIARSSVVDGRWAKYQLDADLDRSQAENDRRLAGEERKQARRDFRKGVIAGFAGVLIGLLAGGLTWFFPRTAPAPTTVAIPNVIGDSQSDATVVVQQSGLHLVFASPASNPVGTVVNEQPSPGTVVKDNSTVTITLGT
jgi:PASTA domain